MTSLTLPPMTLTLRLMTLTLHLPRSAVPLFDCPFVRPSLCSAVPLFGLTLMTSLAPQALARAPSACGGGRVISHDRLILLFVYQSAYSPCSQLIKQQSKE